MEQTTREQELEKTILILQERLNNVKENYSLRSCKKCNNLFMDGWICPECGFDPS